MASEIVEYEPPIARSNGSRPIVARERLPKLCGGGERLLTLLLRAAVMTAVLSAFLLLASAAALALLYVGLASLALRARRQRAPSGRPGAALDVGALPSFHRPAASAAEDCPVCLGAMRPGQRCRALPVCGHVFHSRCVDAWLVRSPACPICRRVVTAPAK